LKNEYEKLKEFLANNRTKLLNEAKEEAKNLVKDANKKIEETIRLIKESEADKGFVKEVRKELEEFKQTLKPETPVVVHTKKKDDDDEIEIIGGEIKEGDYVKVTDTNAVGKVVSLNRKDVTVMIGELKANIRLNRLVKINRKEFRQKDIVIQQRLGGIDINEKMANFNFEIDVRGNRVEEALPRIDSFLDTAIMLNYNELRILHGKGDGILRQVIREHLRKYKQVRSMQDEHVERGGAGITVVQLG
ncbi:MAG: Smr/MutS family protein, partial [Thermoflexibacteraceae bacterium]